MSYLLGYGTAVEWLRQNRATDRLDTIYGVPYSRLEGNRTHLTRHSSHLASLTRPLQLIVLGRENRRRSAEADCHALTTPDGRYPGISIARGLFCSSPGFTFVQMATLLDEERLRFLGMELCGRFGIGSDEKLFLRPQTRTPEDLVQRAQNLPRMQGRRKALAVAPTIIPGAASPMEIALTLMLCAETDQGGYGFCTPVLNHPLPVIGTARKLWDGDSITPDLLWEDAKLILEYDSDLYHSGSARIARDACRRDVLTELGYRVVTVTGEHLASSQQVERIASIVAECLGTPLARADDELWTRRAAFQSRMRHLGTHPEELMSLPQQRTTKRNWHPRG